MIRFRITPSYSNGSNFVLISIDLCYSNIPCRQFSNILILILTLCFLQERNGCRRLLNSYDSGDSTNYTTQMTSRLQQVGINTNLQLVMVGFLDCSHELLNHELT